MNRGRTYLAILLSVGILFISGQPVYAEIDIQVSGNGSDSANSVSSSQSNDTNVSQNNSATVNNDVSQNANTGNNEASGNGGTVDITTGDSTTATDVTNNLNNSAVTVDPCCNGDQSAIISDNGSGSQNSITGQVTITTTVTINQTANITNTVSTKANTGNNVANNNNGNVSITTGDIKASQSIVNVVNQSQESVGAGSGAISIVIKGNGADSQNEVTYSIFNDLLLVRNNTAFIKNNIYADFNTGNNQANDNLGNVLISTGDIDSDIEVVNGPVNTGGTTVECCKEEVVPPPQNPPEQPPAPNNPSNSNPTGGSNVSSSSGNGNGGSVLASLASVLPSTGASALHFWLWAVVYLLMFLSGLYVRLRAGRSPTRAAKAYSF